MEYEAYPRHAELIIHQLVLSSSSRSVSAPKEKSQPRVGHSIMLISANHTSNRSATMRRCYLRGIDLTCNSRQKNWHAGCKHRQLDTWRRSSGSPDTCLDMDDWFKSSCNKSKNRLTNTQKKHVFIQTVLWCPHAPFHQHYARSEFWRVRVLGSGERNVSRTWSGLENRGFGS